MVIPRYQLLPEGQDGQFHCISRCVRRAFLCGWDSYCHKNFDHRKVWIVNRLKILSQVFAIEVVGYSVMENHLHTLLRVRGDRLLSWSDQEVARRWLNICPVRRNSQGNPMDPNELEIDLIASDPERVKELKQRLVSISWFNRFLKEQIAKRANGEDGCTGRFWEGRFKSVALLNEAAVLACLQYMDLNPIRAAIAETPEQSDFTSAQDRIVARQARSKLELVKTKRGNEEKVEERAQNREQLMILQAQKEARRDAWLTPFKSSYIEDEKLVLNMTCNSYLELLD